MGCEKIGTEYGECPNVHWCRLLAISTMLRNRRRVIKEGRQGICSRVEMLLPDQNDLNYVKYKNVLAERVIENAKEGSRINRHVKEQILREENLDEPPVPKFSANRRVR